jgi:glycosyltransferase involved in cell wall biosynthesis
MNHKKIVLVTSSQPSLNPRLVKEADALAEAGYNVVVIGQFWNEWATETDRILLANKKWKFIRVAGSPTENKQSYIFSRIVNKLARQLSKTGLLNYYLAELSTNRCFYPLLKRAITEKGDLYIGHNPGGLAPAVLAAKLNQTKCGFDAEDFHRLEYSNDSNHPDVRYKSFLEEKYFPKADYLITSSPEISEEYQKLFPALEFNTILNVFPKRHDIDVKLSQPSDPLKLFWFSQTIGPNRGLDEVIEAIRIVNSPLIEVHALGYPREQAISYYNSLAIKYGFSKQQLNFYNPIPPDDIFKFAANFDIGLATEIGVPFNRNICLTNKIFTYIQTGLAIIASDTLAQKNLLNNYPDCGQLFKIKDAESLAAALKHYLNNRQALNYAKQRSYDLGQDTLNWETEQAKFLSIVQNTLLS